MAPIALPAGAEIVLSGDSTATAYGGLQRPARSSYIGLVRRALDGGTRRGVVTLAKPARSVAATLAELDRIVSERPSTIVLAHGGWESTLRMPLLLDKVRCYPFGTVPPAGQRFRLLALRRPLWSMLVAFVARSPGHPLLRAAGVRPQVNPEEFAALLSRLVRRLLTLTEADIVLVAPSVLRVTTNPYDRAAFAANRSHLHRVAATLDRVTVVDPHGRLDDDRYWMRDGVHLSSEGHAAVAAMLLPALRGLVPADG